MMSTTKRLEIMRKLVALALGAVALQACAMKHHPNVTCGLRGDLAYHAAFQRQMGEPKSSVYDYMTRVYPTWAYRPLMETTERVYGYTPQRKPAAAREYEMHICYLEDKRI